MNKNLEFFSLEVFRVGYMWNGTCRGIHWMPIITQLLWMNRTSTELIFGFSLVTNSVGNRFHI
jgi:hypothetical protein